MPLSINYGPRWVGRLSHPRLYRNDFFAAAQRTWRSSPDVPAAASKILKQIVALGLIGHRAPLLGDSHVLLRERVPSLFAGVFRPLLALRGMSPVEGGIPLVIDGKIVGGIGVSGVTSEQDGQVAKAGADALSAK